jgi:predicted ribosomally synthesized peptide with SipW-like signal peptide
MKNHANRRRSVSSRTFIAMLALVLVIGCAVGGTVAWLTAKTDAVVNTFTYGDINITLGETTGSDYKIIPGVDIAKDPKVTVKKDSEACWLFVKVEEENWPTFTESDGTRKVKYGIADGWTALTGETGVYYREVGAVTADTSFDVLAGNVVTVSEELTKAEVNSITAENQPKLTFTAYAVQKDGIADADTAWTKANPTTNP